MRLPHAAWFLRGAYPNPAHARPSHRPVLHTSYTKRKAGASVWIENRYGWKVLRGASTYIIAHRPHAATHTRCHACTDVPYGSGYFPSQCDEFFHRIVLFSLFYDCFLRCLIAHTDGESITRALSINKGLPDKGVVQELKTEHTDLLTWHGLKESIQNVSGCKCKDCRMHYIRSHFFSKSLLFTQVAQNLLDFSDLMYCNTPCLQP